MYKIIGVVGWGIGPSPLIPVPEGIKKMKNSNRDLNNVRQYFSKNCQILKTAFDGIASSDSVEAMGVKQVQNFLENLQHEIKLQLEIIEHREIIRDLKNKSLAIKSKKRETKGRAINAKKIASDDEWIDDTPTPQKKQVKEKWIDEAPKKKGRKVKAVQMSIPL